MAQGPMSFVLTCDANTFQLPQKQIRFALLFKASMVGFTIFDVFCSKYLHWSMLNPVNSYGLILQCFYKRFEVSKSFWRGPSMVGQKRLSEFTKWIANVNSFTKKHLTSRIMFPQVHVSTKIHERHIYSCSHVYAMICLIVCAKIRILFLL